MRALPSLLCLLAVAGSASAQDAPAPKKGREAYWADRAAPSERQTPDLFVGVNLGLTIRSSGAELSDREHARGETLFGLGAEARLLLPAGIPLGLIARYQGGFGQALASLKFDAGLEGTFDETLTRHRVDVTPCGVVRVKGQRLVLYPFAGYTFVREETEVTDVDVDDGSPGALDLFLDSRGSVTGHGFTFGTQISAAVSESFGMDLEVALTYLVELRAVPLDGALVGELGFVSTSGYQGRFAIRPWWEVVKDHVFLGMRVEASYTRIAEEEARVTLPGFGAYDAGFGDATAISGSIGFEARFAW